MLSKRSNKPKIELNSENDGVDFGWDEPANGNGTYAYRENGRRHGQFCLFT